MEQPPVVRLDWKEIKDDLKLRINNLEISLVLNKVQLAKAIEFASAK